MEEKKLSNELQLPEEIGKILDKVAFPCPHCYKEINETHLDEKGRYFQYIKEKIRKVTEEELNFQKSIQKKQLLEQIEIERSYEKFGEVIIKNQIIEELTKTKKKLEEENLAIKLKSQEELAKATSYDEIRKLAGFRELEKKVQEYQKENEELKTGNQPEIKALTRTIEELKANLAKLQSYDEIEKLGRVKDLKEEVDKYKKEMKQKNDKLSELTSSEYIEKLDRVRRLVEKNDKLNEQVQLLNHKQRMSKKQGEDLEKYVLKRLQETYNGSDEINKITHLNEKGDIIQEVYKDNQYLAKIIYEVKNKGDKLKKEWVEKLEKDMVNERAEYGVIIASCQNGQPLLKPFPQKNILVSDDENFIFASQIARMLIFSKQRLNQDESSKERIERLDGWVKEKLPNYLLKLGNSLAGWEKDITGITTIVKSMTKTREEIKRTTINEMILELKEI